MPERTRSPPLLRKGERWRQLKPPPASGGVDALELRIGPFHSVLGWHALHGLSVHVGDEVLAQAFGRLAVGGTGVTGESPRAGCRLERQHHRVFVPERVLLPYGRPTDRVALLRVEPLLIDVLGGDPAEKIFR